MSWTPQYWQNLISGLLFFTSQPPLFLSENFPASNTYFLKIFYFLNLLCCFNVPTWCYMLISFTKAYMPYSAFFFRIIPEFLETHPESKRNLTFKPQWLPPPVNTDHTHIARLKMPCFIMSTSGTTQTHTVEDNHENINKKAVSEFISFLLDYFRYLDSTMN